MTLLLALLLGVSATPQEGCPAASEFAAAQSRTLTIVLPSRFNPDSVWARVSRSLRVWWDSDFAVDSSARRQTASPSFELLDVDPSQVPTANRASTAAPSAQATCYFAGRNRNTDRQVAFLFATWRGARANVAILQLWWIGAAKGRSEREWNPDSPEPARLVGMLIGRLNQRPQPR